MTVAKPKTVNPQEEIPEGEQPVSTLESLGIKEQEVVVGAPEKVGGPARMGVPTFKIRVNRDIDNMSHVGGFGAEHFTFEQGHVYENVPYYIVEELERIGAVWH